MRHLAVPPQPRCGKTTAPPAPAQRRAASLPFSGGRKGTIAIQGLPGSRPPPNQSCLMTQNTNIPGNPEGSRTIPLSGLLPPGDNSPQTDGAESCPRAAEVPCPLVPTTTSPPPHPHQPPEQAVQGQGTLPSPLPTIIMGVPGEGRGPNPRDSHPQEPVPLNSCTLRSAPGYFLPPVCAPHPGDSHTYSCPPHKSPQTHLCLTWASPHLPVPPPPWHAMPQGRIFPPAPRRSRLRGSTETGWDGVTQVSSRQARASPGQQAAGPAGEPGGAKRSCAILGQAGQGGAMQIQSSA